MQLKRYASKANTLEEMQAEFVSALHEGQRVMQEAITEPMGLTGVLYMIQRTDDPINGDISTLIGGGMNCGRPLPLTEALRAVTRVAPTPAMGYAALVMACAQGAPEFIKSTDDEGRELIVSMLNQIIEIIEP